MNFYKSEKFIPKLFKSVINQTFTDWELVCVNDCSPAKDGEVLEKLIEKYQVHDKVRVINNPVNLGIFKAKQVGIAAARGRYLTFIDGDDWFAPDALEQLVRPMIDHNVDLVLANNYRILPSIGRKWVMRADIKDEDYNRVMQKDELIDKYFVNFFGINIFQQAYWGKLYKRELLAACDFSHITTDTNEDQYFTLEVIQHVASVYFSDAIIYYWRWGGISSGKKNNLYVGLSYIQRHGDYYMHRLPIIEKYHYNKAIYPMVVEAKNVLLDMISRLSCYEPSDARCGDVKKEILKVFELPAYQHVRSVCGDADAYPQPIYRALASADVDAVYDICHARWKSLRLRRVIKAVLHALLYFNK